MEAKKTSLLSSSDNMVKSPNNNSITKSNSHFMPTNRTDSTQVTTFPSSPICTHHEPRLTESPQLVCSDDKLEGFGGSIKPLSPTSVPATNPLSIQNRAMTAPTSYITKRIVENQTILIWQAYDEWRQKFPRSIEDTEEDESGDQILWHKSEGADKTYASQIPSRID